MWGKGENEVVEDWELMREREIDSYPVKKKKQYKDLRNQNCGCDLLFPGTPMYAYLVVVYLYSYEFLIFLIRRLFLYIEYTYGLLVYFVGS